MLNDENMENELTQIINDVFENHVKQLSRHPETGEFSGSIEYSDAMDIVEDILQSDAVGKLLFIFWQRSSDACPLELCEAEKQEVEFAEWVKTIKINEIIKHF